MRVLIGTPVHQSKDYAIEKWLKNVSEINYPAKLLLVDNSPSTSYLKKIKKYCKKFGLSPILKHISISPKVSVDTRIEASQETIRRYVLSHDYDAWFSWECDQIIPKKALSKLVELMKKGKYLAVFHNSWARWDPTITNTNMGVTLISRKCLKKNLFLPTKKGKISLESKDSYNINNPDVYKHRVLDSGGNYVEVFGMIKPIKHLNN